MDEKEILLTTIDAERINNEEIEAGSAVTFHRSRNDLVVAINGKPVAV